MKSVAPGQARWRWWGGWGILRRFEQKLSVLVGSGVVGGRERGEKSNLWNEKDQKI